MKKKQLILMIISAVFFLCCGTSFLFMPLGDQSVYSGWQLVAGIMFWTGLLGGLAAQMILWIVRKEETDTEAKGAYHRVGMISFLQNFPAMIADGVLGLSIIALILMKFLLPAEAYANYILLCLCFIAFCMHGILNGTVFRSFLSNRKLFRERLNTTTRKKRNSKECG